MYLRDGPIKTDQGIVNLHHFQGSNWVLYIHECKFDSNGCSLPSKLSKFNNERNEDCFFSKYKKSKVHVPIVQLIVYV